ncbi:MAG: hypothetical protein K2Y22_16890 [Candidatus Obscuribacterales bacterium]|nr:hypothetical protein [Candidatus Obscuribacterales bacterium]
MDRLVTEATGSLDTKLAELSRVLTDATLEQSSKVQNDDHMRQDLEGIRKALRGDYQQAARILAAESQINSSSDVRQCNNGVVALANTMYAVSLIKLDDQVMLAQAESLLKSERMRDIAGKNNQIHVQDLNKRALRVALLKQGKHDEVKYIDAVEEVAKVATIHGLSSKWLKEVIEDKSGQIAQAGHDMAKKQEEMLKTSDANRRQHLMQEQTNLCYSSNADKIILEQTRGILAALNRENAVAEQHFKAAFNVIDQDDTLRIPGRRDNSVVHHVDPEYTQIASTLYAFSLLEQKKFAEAEQRFAKEIQRDQNGSNSSDSTVKRLNQLGLEFVQMKLRGQRTAKLPFQTKVIEMAPAPRAAIR